MHAPLDHPVTTQNRKSVSPEHSRWSSTTLDKGLENPLNWSLNSVAGDLGAYSTWFSFNMERSETFFLLLTQGDIHLLYQ